MQLEQNTTENQQAIRRLEEALDASRYASDPPHRRIVQMRMAVEDALTLLRHTSPS